MLKKHMCLEIEYQIKARINHFYLTMYLISVIINFMLDC